jgi:hypothetical protein
MNKTAQILLTAADLIEHVGWTQGSLAKSVMGEDIGPYAHGAVCWCAQGAIGLVGGKDLAATYSANIALDSEVGQVHLWNDHPAQTAENVAGTMRKVALEILGESV